MLPENLTRTGGTHRLSIIAVADAELSSYGQVLGFDTPGVGVPVPIVHGENLKVADVSAEA